MAQYKTSSSTVTFGISSGVMQLTIKAYIIIIIIIIY